jgi:putative ABC transport system permease protein
LASIDPSQPITAIQTLQEVIDTGKAQPRFIMFLIGVFSAIAFLLAIIGIYGVISYSVAQRTPEFGIRMVFGATHRDILNLVLSRGLGLAASGIGIGLIASLGLTRTIASQLYQVSPNDPFTLAASAVLFLFVAGAASYWPARRATHANPMDALHYE